MLSLAYLRDSRVPPPKEPDVAVSPLQLWTRVGRSCLGNDGRESVVSGGVSFVKCR